MIKVLFLHGSNAGCHGRKAARLAGQGDFAVSCPPLPFPGGWPSTPGTLVAWATEAMGSWRRACGIAQAAADEFQPDVIVGSSMGGAVATKIASEAGRVLIAPAWNVAFNGVTIPIPLTSRRPPARTVILHAANDKLVPFAGSLRALEAAAPGTAKQRVLGADEWPVLARRMTVRAGP